MIAKKTFTKVFAKYANFADMFLLDLTSKLFKHTKINNYIIKLVDGKSPPYKSIYILWLVKLGILKAYIETNIANNFIRLFKLLVVTLIFFD